MEAAPATRLDAGVDAGVDAGARDREPIQVIASRFRLVTLATDQVIPVLGPLGEALPDQGLRRGTVITIEGEPGAGSTTLTLDLIAAVTATGGWAVVVQLEDQARHLLGSIPAPAAVEAGVVLDRVAVVRGVSRDRWAVVVAALVEGVGLVITDLPPRVRPADARRIAARARDRGSILVARGSAWPERVAVRLRSEGGAWRIAGGRLVGRELSVEVEGRGAAPRRICLGRAA